MQLGWTGNAGGVRWWDGIPGSTGLKLSTFTLPHTHTPALFMARARTVHSELSLFIRGVLEGWTLKALVGRLTVRSSHGGADARKRKIGRDGE